MDFERMHARAGRLPIRQQAAYSRKRADTFEYGKDTVAGGRSQTSRQQAVQPAFHLGAEYIDKFAMSERRENVLSDDTFVYFPAPLAEPDIWQIEIRDKGVKKDFGVGMFTMLRGRCEQRICEGL